MAGSGGLFFLCTDPLEMKQGSHYDAYTLDEAGQLARLEDKTFNNVFLLDGGRYRLTMDWAEHNGSAVCTHSPADSSWLFLSFTGSPNETLFFLQEFLSEDGTVYPYYPVLIDLENGELTDFLANNRLENIGNAAFTPDRGGLLLAQEGGAIYYYDRDTDRLYSLDELSDEPVRACAVVGKRLICWGQGHASPAFSSVSLGEYHFWAIDLESFQRQELPQLESDADLSQLRFAHLSGFDTWLHENRMYAGSPYALCTNGSGQTYILDMAAWSIRPVEGYTLPASNISCIGSPGSERLLLHDTGSNKAFVLDYSSGRLLNLSIQPGSSLLWFDDSTVLEHAKDDNYYLFNTAIYTRHS